MTNRIIYDKMYKSLKIGEYIRLLGEVSEWFKELVLKTSDSERDRGFESHPLRQYNIFFVAICRSTQVVTRLPC